MFLVENSNPTASAHTPGPWYFSADRNGFYVGKAFNGEMTAVIAKLRRFRANPNWEKEYVPNARLIAAAPKLLEACRAVVNAWESGDLAAAARLCASAVEKAEGR